MLKHDCHRCCLNRRECLQLLSASAIGAGLAASGLTAWAAGKSGPATSDFIDPASLRPKPKVRVAATFLELPRPYWLGWPGTTYDLDGAPEGIPQQLEQSRQQDGRSRWRLEPKPDQQRGRRGRLDRQAKIAAESPHGMLVMLQHMACWNWVTRIAQETAVPVLVFAPVGTAFTGHVDQARARPACA